jgi:hypothetical protein
MIREADRVAADATTALRAGFQMTERDRVLTALACKVDGSFRALIEDCRAQRGEAMHHLKTMTEAFIYFHIVVSDSTERTAERLIADGVANEHAKRLRRLEPGSADLKEWETLRDEFREEAAALGDLAQLADRHSAALGTWYARVYRLACQSAHVADLFEWMPSEDGQVRVGEAAAAATGRLKARIALDYGIEISLGLFEAIAQVNIVGLRIDTAAFRTELTAIREASRSMAKKEEKGGEP